MSLISGMVDLERVLLFSLVESEDGSEVDETSARWLNGLKS